MAKRTRKKQNFTECETETLVGELWTLDQVKKISGVTGEKEPHLSLKQMRERLVASWKTNRNMLSSRGVRILLYVIFAIIPISV